MPHAFSSLTLFLFYSTHTRDISWSNVLHPVQAFFFFFFFKIIVTTTTGCGVCLCLHVCPSFHAGQQRESWKFVISFLFPLLHSLLHRCTLPPLSSIWNTTHAHTHMHKARRKNLKKLCKHSSFWRFWFVRNIQHSFIKFAHSQQFICKLSGLQGYWSLWL